MHSRNTFSASTHGGLADITNTTGQFQPNSVVYESLYSPTFFAKPSLSQESFVSFTPYEGSSDMEEPDLGIHSLRYNSCVIQKHQDMINSHTLCLNQLREATKEVEGLRRENTQLRTVNRELNKHLSLLIRASVRNQYDGSSSHTAPNDIADGLHGLCLGDKSKGSESCTNGKDQEVSDERPTSVVENNTVGTERFSLPKSISVRSNGYLKMVQAADASNGGRTRSITRPRTTSPPKDTQKVYVHGGQKEEEPLEMVVYNQGNFKTELCNKWQETGTCPYGDHCQFAHGIEELRPVIRHPRYKTEVCRMVLAGVVCPYGHRCHFRHALTDQERNRGQHKPGSIKVDR
ncbi:Zinc finger CCCH domain-containing protein [Quillaja saponaria]|uniref:Zinc finger CCCH domain-containing protein n=1 Tax=Quillaja saponaria TaxID=32244 RepID=A0AAD7L9P6_QUISA|nr:Zinc finger CCCH domain-containing protein [Quillaja saponaria]